MTHREIALGILHYQSVPRLPVVHFGYWHETLTKWHEEGHLTREQATDWGDGNTIDAQITQLLGFDLNWASAFGTNNHLLPGFETRVVQTLPDGSQHILNGEGVIELHAPGAVSIHAEIEHLLKDRDSWEKDFKWRYQWSEKRVTQGMVRANDQMLRWDQGGLEFLRADKRDYPYGLYCGSLYGIVRNVLGVEGSAYLLMDDETLFDEITDIVADLSFRNVKFALEAGAKFDFAHFWEDICFKNGPLIAPSVFHEKIGPHYKRITDLLRVHGIDIVSLDCDGCVDSLIPTWLQNGVNTMFPIEVGTWNASIAPWRKQFGKDIRGIGGMNKNVFAQDRQAIDTEIERLKPLVALGGYIPCPDHRIPPEAKWDLVRYYTDRMRKAFSR